MESRDRWFSGIHAPTPSDVSDKRDLDPFGTLHEKHLRLPRSQLIGLLREARRRTNLLIADLSDQQLMGPPLEPISPIWWALGHVAFFYESMVLRTVDQDVRELLPGADVVFDSFRANHDDRWDPELCPLPSRQDVTAYLATVTDAIVARLEAQPELPDAVETYLNLYAIIHEHWHIEDFIHTRQVLGYPAPTLYPQPDVQEEHGPLPGDVEVPGGRFMLGSPPEAPWVFDAERWAHPVELEPFRIARAPVTNEQYLGFVESGGYERRELWSYEGWRWRTREQATRPLYWQEVDGSPMTTAWGQPVELRPYQPVLHVSWWEAEAYCRWAKRRLPTEAEWEAAASAGPDGPGRLSSTKRLYPWADGPFPAEPHTHARVDARINGCADVAAYPQGDSAFGCRQMLGNVWEWTASSFYPYPGFVMDFPYRENSAPWFGYRKVVRGGCWATSALLARTTYRHSTWPQLRSNFIGFRTCALG